MKIVDFIDYCLEHFDEADERTSVKVIGGALWLMILALWLLFCYEVATIFL